MSKVVVFVVVVVCMIVRCKQVNVESLKVNLTYCQSLPSKPVAMQQLVRIAIETKLMKSTVIDGNSTENRRPCTNDSAVKILTVGQLGEDQALYCLKVFLFPHFLQTEKVHIHMYIQILLLATYLTEYNVILIAVDVFPNILHSLVSVFGYTEPQTPAVESEDSDFCLHLLILVLH